MRARARCWTAPPTALAWTEDGRWLWAQHDRVSRLTMKANSPLKSVCELKGVRSLALSPDGKWLACSAGGELFAVSTATRGKNHGVKKRMELKTILGLKELKLSLVASRPRVSAGRPARRGGCGAGPSVHPEAPQQDVA